MSDDVLCFAQGELTRSGRTWNPARPFLLVVGDPVGHSLSPVIQGAALADRGLGHEYHALEVGPDDFAAFLSSPHADHLMGFNATSPLKEVAAKLCSGLTPTAARLGAVNTVRRETDGSWLGHNTDSGGLLMVLSAARGESAPPTTTAVFGTGGAARAAVDALDRWGAPLVTVFYHTEPSRKAFDDWLQAAGYSVPVQLAPLATAAEDPAGIWINALERTVSITSLLPVAAPSEGTLLVDLRYGDGLPAETYPLGFQVIAGKPLLVMQGGLSFAWWFGPPVPWLAMRAALSD